MNKLDDAWNVLRRLSKREQSVAAQAIFDFAAGAAGLGLSDVQAAEVRSRLREKNAKTVSSATVRARLKKLGR
jgi:hypothetical protein